MRKLSSFTTAVVLGCGLLVFQSCYHYRIATSNNDPSTTWEKRTVNAFFWGLVQKRTRGIDVVATNCDSLKVNSLDEVRVTTNFGYALLTVATLGIWCPMQMEWKCPKPCGREGEIR